MATPLGSPLVSPFAFLDPTSRIDPHVHRRSLPDTCQQAGHQHDQCKCNILTEIAHIVQDTCRFGKHREGSSELDVLVFLEVRCEVQENSMSKADRTYGVELLSETTTLAGRKRSNQGRQ